MFKPQSAPASPSVDDNRATEAIGAILLEISDMSVRALGEYGNGGLTRATRAEGGDQIARLHGWRVELGEASFADAVRQAAQLCLRQYHGRTLSAAAVDGITDMLLEIVSQVAVAVRKELS